MRETFSIFSLAEMNTLAASVAARLSVGAVLQLDGTLGAGKTHFVKALAAALGYGGDVSSPTFPLVHEYLWANGAVFHLDFYRLESVEEVFAAGLDEFLPGEGITVVEWASRFPEVFPAQSWRINIDVIDENQREVTIESPLS